MNDPEGAPTEIPEPIGPLPEWTPKSVQAAIQRIEESVLTPEQQAILRRLALDPRMQKVWVEFLKRDRPTGDFLYPAVKQRRPHLRSKEKLQSEALGEILHFAFSAARDKIPVSRFEDILQNEKLLRTNVSMLEALANDLNLALSNGQLGVTDPQSRALAADDIASLINVANWLRHIIEVHRKADDPLVVKRHRKDPIVRGVQILIAELLHEIFGKRLDRTATTLASVALDANASASSARSILTKTTATKRKARQRRKRANTNWRPHIRRQRQ